MNILITGAGGLIGSESVEYYSKLGNNVYGIENNQREIFFGKKGTVNLRLNQLLSTYKNFKNFKIDIRDKKSIKDLFDSIKFDVVIHTAAQPSHDKTIEKQIETNIRYNKLFTVDENKGHKPV